MRILHVVPYFAPAYSYGGPPETVHKLCEALASRGHEITVLTTDAFSRASRQSVKHATNGVEIFYLKNVSNFLAWNHQLFLPLGTGAFLRKRAGDFDLLHVHSFRTFQNVVVLRHTLRTGTPYVFSAHGSVPRIVRKRLEKELFDKIVGQRFLDAAARLIAVSNAEAMQYEVMGIPRSKIDVIPNGVDANLYAALPPRGTFSLKHGIEGRKLVTYLGRLNARKGLDTLLQSFLTMTHVRSDLVLLLVGPDDGYRRHIEKLTKRLSLETRVLFPGLITLPEKLQVLVDSDVVVYPGAFEIFGLVPFEALLCEKPVVVADDSGCGELIKLADAGLTVPPGDSIALSRALERALEDYDAFRPMIERGARFVREKLSWRSIAEQVENTYRRIVARQ